MSQRQGIEEKAAPSSESSKQRELVQFVVDHLLSSSLFIEATIRDYDHMSKVRMTGQLRQLQEINHAVINKIREGIK